MDWFSGPNWIPVAWVIVAVVLLIFEVLGASGFLIGAAVAALALAVLTFVISDLGMVAQFLSFAIIAVIATLVYFKFFKMTQPSNKDSLPGRSQMMLGRRFILEEELPAGVETRVQLGDTMWRVVSDGAIAQGSNVVVVGGDEMQLHIEVVEEAESEY